MTYSDIVFIGNEVRFILNTTYNINLAAQNASLAARNGGNIKGFQVVANELKNFSNKLAGAMDILAKDIFKISESVSMIYKEQRVLNIFQDTTNRLNDINVLQDVIQQANTRYDEIYDLLQERLINLEKFLTRSLKEYGRGMSLARSALIESSVDSISVTMLKNVARDLERTINDIFVRLKTIEKRVITSKECA